MIRTVKGDITKVTDVQAIVNAAKIAVRTVARFLQENPGQFDLVEWMLFDLNCPLCQGHFELV